MVPGLLCTHPCKTCSSANTASCTSCYTTLSTISEKHLFSNTCLTACPSGYYAEATTLVCTACDTRCLTCSSSSTCDTCSTTGTYRYLYESMCYANSCPTTTYESSSFECSDCSSPCNECSGGSGNGNCLSCSVGANSLVNLLDTTCYSTCPNGYVPISRVCSACTSPCLTCTIN